MFTSSLPAKDGAKRHVASHHNRVRFRLRCKSRADASLVRAQRGTLVPSLYLQLGLRAENGPKTLTEESVLQKERRPQDDAVSISKFKVTQVCFWVPSGRNNILHFVLHYHLIIPAKAQKALAFTHNLNQRIQ